VTQALDRVRKAARQRKKGQFTVLLHHINADTLRTAFYALRGDARPVRLGKARLRVVAIAARTSPSRSSLSADMRRPGQAGAASIQRRARRRTLAIVAWLLTWLVDSGDFDLELEE
jgi:hypothetical protein